MSFFMSIISYHNKTCLHLQPLNLIRYLKFKIYVELYRMCIMKSHSGINFQHEGRYLSPTTLHAVLTACSRSKEIKSNNSTRYIVLAVFSMKI